MSTTWLRRYSLAAAALACVVYATAVADPFKECKFTGSPVSTCPCPIIPGNPPDYSDRCIGSLPLAGYTRYGEVACQPASGNCTPLSTASANSCGIVVACEQDCTVNFGVVDFTNGCSQHPEKPACGGSWGWCTWSESKL